MLRKEKVTPIGKPDFVKAIKIGIDEHEQNGVTVPSKAPIIFAGIPLIFPSIHFVFSGVKYDWIYD